MFSFIVGSVCEVNEGYAVLQAGGIGFEVLRACGKYDNLFTRIISAPGLWMQRITTKEPADDMIEIAIAALRACEPENPDVDRAIDKEVEGDNE